MWRFGESSEGLQSADSAEYDRLGVQGLMKLIDQILLGSVIIVVEITLIVMAILWSLRERWCSLDGDPEVTEWEQK